jgi:methylenetetrahydrofolate reductase (NADPH)
LPTSGCSNLLSEIFMGKNVIEILAQAEETLFSFEILPPLKGAGIEDLYAAIDLLMEFNPSFINVTYHREEYIYKKREKGYLEKISIRKRPGTVGICAAIKNKYGVITVPHLTCGGFSREDTENALIDLSFLDINNILALRGDPIKTESVFNPHQDGHEHAIGLVEQVVKMNKGQYLDEEMQSKNKTSFCVGVAGYPEKHMEAMSMKSDLKHLKEKIDAGAEYVVTQMFFDNAKYFEFVDKCRAIGIDCPIIPGLKPLTTLRHIDFIPKTFSVSFPEELSDQLEDCSTNEEVRKVGVAWAIKQSKELKEAGVPCLHYYTMGRSDSVKDIVSEVF